MAAVNVNSGVAPLLSEVRGSLSFNVNVPNMWLWVEPHLSPRWRCHCIREAACRSPRLILTARSTSARPSLGSRRRRPWLTILSRCGCTRGLVAWWPWWAARLTRRTIVPEQALVSFVAFALLPKDAGLVDFAWLWRWRSSFVKILTLISPYCTSLSGSRSKCPSSQDLEI